MDRKQFKILQKKFDGQLNLVLKDVADLKENINKINNVLKYGKEIDRLNKAISNALNFSEKKFSTIMDEISRFDVKKIDLAKIESRSNALRDEMEKFTDIVVDVKQLKENFIKFRKKALTKYNFSRLERWMGEIEKELLELISIRGELSKLSGESKAKLTEIGKMLEKHDRVINKLRRKDYRDVKKCETKLMKHIDMLADSMKQNERAISLVNTKIKRGGKQIKIKRGKKKKREKRNFFKKTKDLFVKTK